MKLLEKESKSDGLEKEDAMSRERWRVGVGEVAAKKGEIRPPMFMMISPDQN